MARRKARRTRLFGNRWSVLPPTALGLTLAFGAPPAWADEVIDNSSETVIGTGGGTQASPWNISGGLTVGFNNTGTLDISAGGSVSNTYSYLGLTTGSDGTVTVDGAGSKWTNSEELTVGESGTGTLSITNGGTVTGLIGYVGVYSGADGKVTVDGTDSTWTSSSSITIGLGAAGAATVSDGGTIQASGNLTLGRNSGSTGTLDILDGGTVTAGDDSFIGHLAGSDGTMNVSGDGSSFDTGSNYLYVGDEGTGALNIENGGAVSSRLGIIGNDIDSVGTAEVDGDGSTWTTSLALTVGNIGSGTLNITDSGTVNSNGGYVGINSGSDSTATVDGTGSSWTNSGFLNIGEAGTGTLNITNGGAVSDTTGQLGSRIGSNGAATVDGAGSTWTNSLNLVVGFRGAGTLTVSDGGAVSSDAGYIGYDTASNGAVTVEGTGSTWTISSDLYVGSEGTAELTISDGGRVEANSGNGQVILADVSGTGTLNIGAAAGDTATGAGTLDAGTVTFGDGDGTLNFNHTDTDYEFAAAISGAGAINHLAGVTTLTGVSVGYSGVTTITGGTLQIDGTLGGVLSGVQRVENGAFVIENGGVAVNLTEDSTVGTDNGDVGVATVTGVGSSWVNSHDLFVGEFGTGTLTIADGAAVSNDNAYVGNQADATGTVTVTGSTWNTNSGLYLGFDGTATLNVEGGGTVGSESSVIGYRSGSDGTVTVTGAGSTWTSQTMLVGNRGNGAFIVADGGEASIEYGDVGVETGTGAVTVTGAGSSLTSSNELVVGDFTTGTLTIADGGVVQSSSGIVEVGKELGGNGTLNIGAAAGETAVGAGTLDAEMVQFGFGAGTINFNHTDTDYEFAADISRSYGSGTINHIAGITRLTGDASAFNGTTDISGGSLYVNTTLGGVVNVAGGTLGGSGTLGSVTIGSGGTLAPGNSIGTITVNGDLALTSGSTYAVEVSPSAADQTIVTGTATIAGTLTTSYSGGSYTSGTQYTLINSTGALSGTFASVSATNLPYGFLADVSYDLNNVFLTLTQYLDSGDGQIYANGTTTAIADERLLRNAVLDHLLAPGDGMVLWGQGFGGYNKFDDGLTIDHHHGGAIAGFDLPLDNGIRAGVAAAYTNASTSVPAYGGSADGDGGHVLAYASWTEGPVALRGGAALGWGSSDVTRSVSSVGETNTSSRPFRTEQIFADAGYAFDIAGASLEPHLGLEHVHASMDSFQESGGPLSSFSGDGSDASATFTTLGIRALGGGIPAGGFEVTPSLDLGWRHGFGLSRPRQSVTVDNTGTAYVFYGTPLAEDALTVKIGADFVMAPSFHLYLGYDGFLSSHSRDNTVTGKLAWEF